MSRKNTFSKYLLRILKKHDKKFEKIENKLKNAINYELQRDGQVYYLYNRVESIYEFAQQLKALLPNIRLAVAHGQMDKNMLEQIMTDFLNKEYDVLLCTTIIESGLDIPNANTIIAYISITRIMPGCD